MIEKFIKAVTEVIAAGGGGALVAWLIFSRYGDQWLEQKFATRLEQFKHEKAQEIERLRHQISATFSRISKIHEKEFDVLPAAFLKLHTAYGGCYSLASALQQYPALNNMPTELFTQFVANSRLPDFRKQELLQARSSDRDDYYRRWIFWVDLGRVQSARDDFHNFLVMNRIFMTDDLRERFGEIDNLINSVLNALEVDREAPGSGLLQNARQDLAKIAPLLGPLETAIQKRLHYQEA